ncbi:MAG: amidohydrolase family protein [Gemmatimonadales bacterium]
MTKPAGPIRLSADWVIPIDRSPMFDAAILIDAEGRIAELGPAGNVPSPPGGQTAHFAGAALLPGLVNAHTHLELTGLAGKVDDADFTRWIRGVRELKADLTADWFATAARQGVRDCFAAGITYVLDTGDSGAVFGALIELGGAGTVYQEVFGPHPDQVATSLAELTEKAATARSKAPRRVNVGISPHAPYTVSAPLYRAVARLAQVGRYPIAVHLAESPAETAFVVHGQGPFADAWQARGIPPLADQRPNDPAARRSPVAWLDAQGILTPQTLVIHAVQVDAQDVAILAERNVGVAICPLSNRRHGHGDPPLKAMRQAGIKVGVGTDSVLSVGKLDLFAEMRAARTMAGLSARRALALGTAEAARLASPAADFGSLTKGLWGDVVAVALPGTPDQDPEERVLMAGPDQILATYASGRLVYRQGHPT